MGVSPESGKLRYLLLATRVRKADVFMPTHLGHTDDTVLNSPARFGKAILIGTFPTRRTNPIEECSPAIFLFSIGRLVR